MASPVSFIPILERWCEKIKPKRILEWGPGYSTQMMLELTKADIISVENDPHWHGVWKEKLDPKRVMVILLEDMDEYTTPVSKEADEKFDMIFVDGRERVRCMKFAKDVVKEDGVVILHDAERERYKEGIDIFDVIDTEEGTVCMKLK